MKHLGDITAISGAEIPFVDCITFGSPCQDLSMAGKRAGLNGKRSALFLEAVRIIKEMREKSGGIYPAFAVWENVPGAFSSNGGNDFKTVLEELARIKEPEVSVPRPENGKWAKAGFICGNEWSLAWRTLDAQFWGVPQRRRRIALVVDFGGQRAGEILLERTGVSGDLEPSIPPWKGIARNPAHGPAGHDRVLEEPIVVYDARGNEDGKICPCITGDHENRVTDYTAIVAFAKEVLTLRNGTVANALMARDYKGVGRADSLGKVVAVKTPLRWTVRRLTPTEGERLQGFPDGWTDIGEWVDSKGKHHKSADTPRYKALGNSIALPQWWWLTCKMARYLPERATLGSLFDGIGGFPLVWETRHGKGTALWASEIEEFAIAVTKIKLGK